MASRSRAVQAQLEELEKLSAPFEDQLAEAAKFIGVYFEENGRISDDTAEAEKLSRIVPYRREEWLLVWLLKKLKSEEAARRNPSSWWLLSYIVTALPVRTAARLLAGRDVIVEEKVSKEGKNSILLQTLEDTYQSFTLAKEATSSEDKDKPIKKSKKRKHTGELLESAQHHDLPNLLGAISSFLNGVVAAGNFISGTSPEDVGAALSAAYMKTAITTTAEKAATILGSWLSLCNLTLSKIPEAMINEVQKWLTPFIELWDSRVADEASLIQFSQRCTRPLLSLLRALKDGHFSKTSWLPQVERLLAKNIMIPAKAARLVDAESDLLSTLVKDVVFEDAFNAPPLYEIAIRSIQPHGSRRRRPQDDAWLQTVFDTLKDALSPQLPLEHGSSIGAILRFAIQHKANLDLQALRAVTIQFALPDGQEDWGLVATLIKLDANVFLIPSEEIDLLKTLLERITKASLEPSWSEISEQVVSQVVVPLISEFSKARDLAGFIHHWYAQLVEFERVRNEDRLFSLVHFSAWEDDAVQAELKRLFEPSLTIQQISQLLDWLSSEVSEHPDAVCVVLEAIAGAISSSEVVDKVSLRLYHIMFDNHSSEKLDSRYSWRAWRILSQTSDWALPSDADELGKLWDQKAQPFDSWPRGNSSDSLLEVYSGNKASLDNLERLRCAGAILSATERGSRMEAIIEPAILTYLRRLRQDLNQFLRDLGTDSDMGEETCGSKQNTLYRGIGWMLWSFIQCIFVEYPKILRLGPSLEGDDFNEIIQTTLWVASADSHTSSEKPHGWLKTNNQAFSTLWTRSLQLPEVLKNKRLTEKMVDVMLCNESNLNNPLLKSPGNNIFVLRILNQVPLDIVNRNDKERIMKGWLTSGTQEPTSQMTALEPGILALKRRVMEKHPNLYEGLEFETLLEMADKLGTGDVSTAQTNLAILKELARLSLAHAQTNLDQDRRRRYVADAFETIKKKMKKASEKKRHQLTYAQVSIFEVALHEYHKKATPLNELSIISKKDLEIAAITLKGLILAQLQDLLHTIRKAKDSTPLQDLSLQTLIDALDTLEIEPTDLTDLTKDAKKVISLSDEIESDARKHLKRFFAVHGFMGLSEDETEGNVSTIYGRESIKEITLARTSGKDNQQKLELLHFILGEGFEALARTDKLLAARFVIASIEDAHKTPKTAQDNSTDDDDEAEQISDFDLTKVYILLCQQLQKSTDILQFCIISETLELMLKTKPRLISQYAIDLTLGTISILCSPSAPSLPTARSGTIYLHLCTLLRTILTHHRLKLKGHFPLVQLAMQGLLRCLFCPLPRSNINAKSTPSEFGPTPSWLSSSAHQLTAKHAEAYTRLLTLICDPSASSVRGARHNNLTSATEKWKRMALLFMRFVLMDYIKWQLEMRMLPEVREKLVPGVYAIFDATTLETRRLISSELTTSGRAVFGTLYRNYQKFGKWKGN